MLRRVVSPLRAATLLSLVPLLGQGLGNHRCWSGHFTYDFCCNSSLSEEGNPDCWDKRQYTHRRCCLSPDEEIPPAHPVNPNASKRWRVACSKDLGGWMVHELVFYTDEACSQRIRKHARVIDSGHRKGFEPGHAFDQWVKGTDEFFWYSGEASRDDPAWLGLDLVRPAEVLCVAIWHNNIPALPVSLQRWEDAKKEWIDIRHWSSARGGEWAQLTVRRPLEESQAVLSEL
jgi:hypothetical protein